MTLPATDTPTAQEVMTHVDTNDQPKYIIRYSGKDILGLINTTLLRLQANGFKVHDLSMASGSKVNTTFITCQRFPTSQSRSSSNTDKVHLHCLVRDSLQAVYVDSGYPSEKPDVKVTEASEADARADQFRMFIEISCKDEPGLLADFTTLLRTAFSIDTLTVRQSWTEAKLPGDYPLKNIAVHVTPLLVLSQEPPINDILDRNETSKHFIRFDKSIKAMRERRSGLLKATLAEGTALPQIEKSLETHSVIGEMDIDWNDLKCCKMIDSENTVRLLIKATHDILMILNNYARYDFAVKRVASTYPNEDGPPICLNVNCDEVREDGKPVNLRWTPNAEWPTEYYPRRCWQNPRLNLHYARSD